MQQSKQMSHYHGTHIIIYDLFDVIESTPNFEDVSWCVKAGGLNTNRHQLVPECGPNQLNGIFLLYSCSKMLRGSFPREMRGHYYRYYFSSGNKVAVRPDLLLERKRPYFSLGLERKFSQWFWDRNLVWSAIEWASNYWTGLRIAKMDWDGLRRSSWWIRKPCEFFVAKLRERDSMFYIENDDIKRNCYSI